MQSETGEASNIKDKCNRKNVIRVLMMISGLFKTIDQKSLGDNGILVFVGIDKSGQELKHILQPPNPISEFYYKCTKHFETERFEELFYVKPMGNVVFISGNECIIYQFNGQWKKIKTMNANLIKRQKKGGQSSVRFSRLAEESRVHYITHVVDWINQLVLPNQNNYVFGSRELKDMLLENPELKIKFKTDDIYHVFNEYTIQESYFKNLMVNPVFSENKKVDNIIELLNRDPDYLLFTLDEINENINGVEYIINIRNNKEIASRYGDKSINLPLNHQHYGVLQNYVVIGKLYVKRVDAY